MESKTVQKAKLFLTKYKVIRYFLWRLKRKAIPKTDGLYLHIGCGTIDYPGFINIDKYPHYHVHHIMDADDLRIFSDNSIDLIYMSHCLEHFTISRVPAALAEYYRVLKKGGILRISVPDFDKILKVYEVEQTIESIEYPILGGQDYKYNFHYSIFNLKYLSKKIKNAGFVELREWQHSEERFKNLPDWSGKKIIALGNTTMYDINLNIEAIK